MHSASTSQSICRLYHVRAIVKWWDSFRPGSQPLGLFSCKALELRRHLSLQAIEIPVCLRNFLDELLDLAFELQAG